MIEINNYLRVNLVDMTLVCISTFLIVLIAKKYFWNYLKEYLAKREMYISEQLANANANNLASDQLKQEAKARLDEVYKEANDIIENAKEMAEKESQKIIDDAKINATLIKEKALNDLEKEKIASANKLRLEISEIALNAAKKVISKEIDQSIYDNYIQEFIDKAGDK